MTTPQPTWTTSSFCSVGTCVSVAHTDNTVMVRHSAHPDGATLTFSREEWVEFLAGVRAGEFDVTPSEGVGAAIPADPPRPDAHDRFCDGTCKRRKRGSGWMCPDPHGPGRALLSGGEQT